MRKREEKIRKERRQRRKEKESRYLNCHWHIFSSLLPHTKAKVKSFSPTFFLFLCCFFLFLSIFLCPLLLFSLPPMSCFSFFFYSSAFHRFKCILESGQQREGHKLSSMSVIFMRIRVENGHFFVIRFHEEEEQTERKRGSFTRNCCVL